MKNYISRINSWFDYLPHNLQVWYPLRLLKYCGLDILYGTKVLGWEFDRGHLPDNQWHFHTKSGRVVKPSDYGRTWLVRKKV